MYIGLELKWASNSPEKQIIEPELFGLLGGILQNNSLQKAAQNTGVSYRHAWGLIKKWETHFKTPLVDLKRGRGRRTQLTPFGAGLYSEYVTTENKLTTTFKKAELGLNKNLSTYLDKTNIPGLKISASHDLVINLLSETLASEYQLDNELKTRGSLENLKSLINGHCNIAGFHYPLEKIIQSLKPKYIQWLDGNTHDLVLLSVRKQGIMVKKENIKKIMKLSDLTKRSVKYINRQKNSGTRILFDELIKQENIQPKRIKGYLDEEFTHIAVAAVIASGAADAGMGLEAAARKFGLHFIPQLREAYFLAFNKSDMFIKKKIIETINSRNFKNSIKNMPGYDFKHTGIEFTVNNLLAENIDML